MKKTYIAPEIIITELDSKETIMSLSARDSLQDTEWGGEATGIDADARNRRGKWGNLWSEGE